MWFFYRARSNPQCLLDHPLSRMMTNERVSNVAEFTMAALAGGETHGTGCTLALHHAGRARPFGTQSVHLEKALLQKHRAAVGAHTALRKARDLVCKCLRGSAALSIGHQALTQTDALAFVRRHLAPGEDDVERRAPPDHARQPHRPAVNQRHAPAPAINAHVGALLHHT